MGLNMRGVMDIDYGKLPEHMRAGVRGYVEDGGHIGGFLTALFSNNLVKTYGYADGTNKEAMSVWVDFLYWEAPAPCWGSIESVIEWQESGGLNGCLAASSAKEEEVDDERASAGRHPPEMGRAGGD